MTSSSSSTARKKDTQHYPVYDDIGPRCFYEFEHRQTHKSPIMTFGSGNGGFAGGSPLHEHIPIEETEAEEREAILLHNPNITQLEFEMLKDSRRSDRMQKIAYAKHMAELEFKRNIENRSTTIQQTTTETLVSSKTMAKTTTTITQVEKKKKKDEEQSNTYSFVSANAQLPPSTNPDILKARELYDKSNNAFTMKITDIDNFYDLESYLNCKIFFQVDAVADISRIIWTTKDDSTFSETSPFILPLLLSGTTGTGKTHSIKIFKQLFEMDSGGKHADCFIEYRFGGCSDDSTINQLTGASPGYLGFKDKDCETLCDKLKRACDHYKDVLAHIDPSYTSQLPKNFYNDDDDGEDPAKKRPFCVILLFIDEADKATRKVWNILNSFLSDGCLPDTSNGKIFTIPRGIRVLVCITANFGAEKMVNENVNNEEDYERVKDWVLEDIKLKGYNDCDISRFAKNIIPFFPPSTKNIRIILYVRFIKHLLSNENRFNQKYGKAFIEEDDLQHYIDTFIEKYNQLYGIRQAHETLDKDLKNFASQNLHHFDKYLSKKVLPLAIQPQLSFKSIPFTENMSQEELLLTNPDINAAVKDSVNLRNLKGRLRTKNNVDFLTMTHPDLTIPSVNILSSYKTTIVYNDNRQYNCDPNFLEKFERVLNEKKDSQSRLLCMGNALREVCDIIECDEEVTDNLKRKVDDALVRYLPKRNALTNGEDHEEEGGGGGGEEDFDENNDRMNIIEGGKGCCDGIIKSPLMLENSEKKKEGSPKNTTSSPSSLRSSPKVSTSPPHYYQNHLSSPLPPSHMIKSDHGSNGPAYTSLSYRKFSPSSLKRKIDGIQGDEEESRKKAKNSPSSSEGDEMNNIHYNDVDDNNEQMIMVKEGQEGEYEERVFDCGSCGKSYRHSKFNVKSLVKCDVPLIGKALCCNTCLRKRGK